MIVFHTMIGMQYDRNNQKRNYVEKLNHGRGLERKPFFFYIGKLCTVRTVPFFSSYTNSLIYLMSRTFCKLTHPDYKLLWGPQNTIQNREVFIIFKWTLSFSQKLASFEAAQINLLHTGYKFLIYLSKKVLEERLLQRREAEPAHFYESFPSELVVCCHNIFLGPCSPSQIFVTSYFDIISDL